MHRVYREVLNVHSANSPGVFPGPAFWGLKCGNGKRNVQSILCFTGDMRNKFIKSLEFEEV